MQKPLAVLDAASDGEAVQSPRRLAELGLIEQLRAEDAGIARGPDVAGRIAGLLSQGKLCVVTGQTCDLALAAAKALAGRGRIALAYIDGHTDFKHEANPLPQPKGARSELALLVGRTVDGAVAQSPFRDEDTAVIAFRRHDPAFVEINRTPLLLWPMFWLYEHPRIDIETSLRRRFDRDELDGIWIHVDLDALDPKLLPGVATPIDDGLSVSELQDVLRVPIGTGKVLGISVSNVTPSLLADPRQAGLVVETLVQALAPMPEADDR